MFYYFKKNVLCYVMSLFYTKLTTFYAK